MNNKALNEYALNEHALNAQLTPLMRELVITLDLPVMSVYVHRPPVHGFNQYALNETVLNWHGSNPVFHGLDIVTELGGMSGVSTMYKPVFHGLDIVTELGGMSAHKVTTPVMHGLDIVTELGGMSGVSTIYKPVMHDLNIILELGRMAIEQTDSDETDGYLFLEFDDGTNIYRGSSQGIEDPRLPGASENELRDWAPIVTQIPELEYQPIDDSGWAKIRWGSMAVVPGGLGGSAICDVRMSYGPASYAAFEICRGRLELRDNDPRQTREDEYELFEHGSDVMILETGQDENGNECVIPLVVGAVSHAPLQRTGAPNEQRYYRPDFVGDIGHDWFIFENGVDISTHWVENGDGTISRTVNVLGELSASGSASMRTLEDVANLVCGKLGISLKNPHGANLLLDFVVSSNDLARDWLGRICFYCNYTYYIRGGYLYLINNEIGNGSNRLDSIDIREINENHPISIKKFYAEWQTRESASEAGGNYLKTVPRSVDIFGSGEIDGEERQLPAVFNSDPDTVKARMEILFERLQKSRISIRTPMRRWPAPAEIIFFTEDNGKSGMFTIDSIRMHYRDKELEISGTGMIS